MKALILSLFIISTPVLAKAPVDHESSTVRDQRIFDMHQEGKIQATAYLLEVNDILDELSQRTTDLLMRVSTVEKVSRESEESIDVSDIVKKLKLIENLISETKAINATDSRIEDIKLKLENVEIDLEEALYL